MVRCSETRGVVRRGVPALVSRPWMRLRVAVAEAYRVVVLSVPPAMPLALLLEVPVSTPLPLPSGLYGPCSPAASPPGSRDMVIPLDAG